VKPLQLVDISKLVLDSKINKFSYSFICGKGWGCLTKKRQLLFGNLEHAFPISFIGENQMTESYVVGMTCTRGALNIPGMYKAENGKLIAVK